jgi:hypothetical protein
MRLTVLAFTVLYCILSGCGSKVDSERLTSSGNERLPSAKSSPGDSVQPSRRLATTTAGKAKDQLAQRLTARLTEVMQSDGPVAAIRVCSQEANVIAGEVGGELGVRIGRTSQRLRNPKNTEPNWAAEWVEQGDDQPQAKLLDDGTTVALFPIKLQPQCVMCHGQEEELAEPVRAALTDFYPLDRATGFNIGDLRGWFWVEVPRNE